jgi:hypothetical protein
MRVLGASTFENSLGVDINLIVGALAGVRAVYPLPRSVAFHALPCVGIEVRSLGVTHTLAQGCFEGKTRRAALAFLGVWVPVSVCGTGVADFCSFVPVHWLVAGHTDVVSIEVRSVSGTVA